MATAGVKFLNTDNILKQQICPFTTVDDVIAARDKNRNQNKGNNSTYITRSSEGITQIYGKTYGASKKEAALLCIAVSRLAAQIELYEICEQDLSELPKPDLEVIQLLGNIKIIPTNLTMERREFEKDNSLRSPSFTYNLLEKLGPKKCALCECGIPELIEGAHIWPVADIKNTPDLDIESKIEFATDGDNGIWLCENHHKLFDADFLRSGLSGTIEWRPGLEIKSTKYMSDITLITQLAFEILTTPFADYLKKRYNYAV